MGVGEEPGFSGKEGCRVFCAGVIGTGCTITGGAARVEPVIAVVAVDSDAPSDIFTSFISVSAFC